ncbi:hypothetical protein FKM82_026878 [Ascaphus truei]
MSFYLWFWFRKLGLFFCSFGHRTSLVPKSDRYHGPVNVILSGEKEIPVCLVLCVQMGLFPGFQIHPSLRRGRIKYSIRFLAVIL